ncbi:MAG: T9SS type A sorting domain-containing protein [Bacteroidales bacterium]
MRRLPGYNPFSFQLGLDGYYDGYYYIDSLAAGGNYFNFQHDAIVGIRPDGNGIIELHPPQGLTSTIEAHSVDLNWSEPILPSSLELIGYNIFRNDTLVNSQIVDGVSFTDPSVPAGSHSYRVQSVFIGEANGPFASIEAYISNVSQNDILPFTIYPNPVSDPLFIIMEFQSGDNTVLISDLSGRTVHKSYFMGRSDKSVRIDIDLPAGVYFLELSNDTHSGSQKIVVK